MRDEQPQQAPTSKKLPTIATNVSAMTSSVDAVVYYPYSVRASEFKQKIADERSQKWSKRTKKWRRMMDYNENTNITYDAGQL